MGQAPADAPEGPEMWAGRADGSLRELGRAGSAGSAMLAPRENGDGCPEAAGGVSLCQMYLGLSKFQSKVSSSFKESAIIFN